MLINPTVVASWPKPNYVDPETRGPAAVAVIFALLGLVTILLCIRFYTRIVISKGFGLDDILIVAAYIPAVAFAAIGIYAFYQLGWDKHIWDVSPELYIRDRQFSLISQVLFGLSTTLTKLSIVALLYRLVVATKSRFRFVVLAVGITLVIDETLFMLMLILQCMPVSDYWTFSFTAQRCINEGTHLLAAGIINTATDFVLVLLPLPITLKLQLPMRQRLIVVALFCGGILASGAGAVRTYFTWRISTQEDLDITWLAIVVILVSAVELYVGIICASVPATKPFFKKFLPKLLGTQHWLEVTEPLAERSKQPSNNRSSFMSGSTKLDTVLSAHRDSLPTFHKNSSDVSMQSHQRPVSPAQFSPRVSVVRTPDPNLNKPLPKIRVTVDRTFSWSDLSSRASDSRGTILVGLAEPFSSWRPGSTSTQGRGPPRHSTDVPPLPSPVSADQPLAATRRSVSPIAEEAQDSREARESSPGGRI